jgi:hypothetical protein
MTGRDERSRGMGTLTAEVLAKMKPSYPLRLAEQEPEEVETDRLWLARDVFFFLEGVKPGRNC